MNHELGIKMARKLQQRVRVNNVIYEYHEYQGDQTESYNKDYQFGSKEYYNLGDGCYKAKQKGVNDV